MTAPVQRRAVQRIPPGLWQAVASGLAGVVLMFGFMFWWTDKRVNDLSAEKDQAMCQILDIIVAGPEPEAGPDGDRARSIRHRMTAYQRALHCDKYREG